MTLSFSADPKYDYLEIKGDEKADIFFKFAADNTDVEWANIKTGKDKNTIATAHMKGMDPAGSIIACNFIEQGVSIREDIHSHPDNPGNMPEPGPGDRDYVKYMQETYGRKAPLSYKVYSAKTKETYQYNKFGVIK